MRRNKFERKPQANHRREPAMMTTPFLGAVPKHKHQFKSYTLEKNERQGNKIQIVECTVEGCTLRFVRDKEFKP